MNKKQKEMAVKSQEELVGIMCALEKCIKTAYKGLNSATEEFYTKFDDEAIPVKYDDIMSVMCSTEASLESILECIENDIELVESRLHFYEKHC